VEEGRVEQEAIKKDKLPEGNPAEDGEVDPE